MKKKLNMQIIDIPRELLSRNINSNNNIVFSMTFHSFFQINISVNTIKILVQTRQNSSVQLLCFLLQKIWHCFDTPMQNTLTRTASEVAKLLMEKRQSYTMEVVNVSSQEINKPLLSSMQTWTTFVESSESLYTIDRSRIHGVCSTQFYLFQLKKQTYFEN